MTLRLHPRLMKPSALLPCIPPGPDSHRGSASGRSPRVMAPSALRRVPDWDPGNRGQHGPAVWQLLCDVIGMVTGPMVAENVSAESPRHTCFACRRASQMQAARPCYHDYSVMVSSGDESIFWPTDVRLEIAPLDDVVTVVAYCSMAWERARCSVRRV